MLSRDSNLANRNIYLRTDLKNVESRRDVKGSRQKSNFSGPATKAQATQKRTFLYFQKFGNKKSDLDNDTDRIIHKKCSNIQITSGLCSFFPVLQS